MTDKFEITYWETLTGNPVAIGVVIGFVILLSVGIWLRYRPRNPSSFVEDKVEDKKVNEKPDPENGSKSQSILGTGRYKCMAFKLGNTIAWTTIPKPIGEAYFFEPTTPISGVGYIVREAKEGETIDGKKTKEGDIVDYDPREVQVELEKMPEHAWDAMNWKDDVEGFWIVPINWWRTPSMWFALGMMVIVFISSLVVLE